MAATNLPASAVITDIARMGLCNGPVSVRPSVCLSHLLTVAAACGGFAAGRSAGTRYRSTAAGAQQQRRRRASFKHVRRILVRGPMPPCRLRRRKFRKSDYEMAHSEVLKMVFFPCSRFLIFHLFFQGGQLTTFAPMCRRPWPRCTAVGYGAQQQLRAVSRLQPP